MGAEEEFKGWARLELMGHRVEVGYVETVLLGGAASFKVTMPSEPPALAYYGVGSLYALTPVSEVEVRQYYARRGPSYQLLAPRLVEEDLDDEPEENRWDEAAEREQAQRDLYAGDASLVHGLLLLLGPLGEEVTAGDVVRWDGPTRKAVAHWAQREILALNDHEDVTRLAAPLVVRERARAHGLDVSAAEEAAARTAAAGAAVGLLDDDDDEEDEEPEADITPEFWDRGRAPADVAEAEAQAARVGGALIEDGDEDD